MNKGLRIVLLLMVVATAAAGWYIVKKSWEVALLPIPQDRTWVEIDTVQCLGNPWEVDWLQSHNHDAFSYPRNVFTPGFDAQEVDIIKNYYEKNYQITIYDVGPSADHALTTSEKILLRIFKNPGEGMVCLSCGCSHGPLYLFIKNSDAKRMADLGYQLSSGPQYFSTIGLLLGR